MTEQASVAARVRQVVRELPAFSATTVKLMQLLRDDDASPRDIESCVRFDASLTARVLRLANSAAMGRAAGISDISRAVVMLGRAALYRIATAAALAEHVPDHIPGYEVDSREFWVHSAAVALAARSIARRSGHCDPEQAFTAGLLHDVGSVVLGGFVQERWSDLEGLVADQVPMLQAECDVLGATHTDTGRAMLESWSLPAPLAIVAEFHHTPSQCPDPAVQPLADAVHVADLLAYSVGLGRDAAGLARAVDTGALARLGSVVDAVDDIVAECVASTHTLADAFDVAGGAKR